MKKVLFVAYNTGTPALADAVQSDRLIKALGKFYIVDVLTRYVKNRTKKESIQIKSPNFGLIDRLLYKILPSLHPTFSIDRLVWAHFAFIKVKTIIHNYDYIFVAFEPFSIRTLPLKLAYISDAKLVSFFYDPLVDNIFYSQSKKCVELRSRAELEIVSSSDYIFVSNEKEYNAFIERYPGKSIALKHFNFCGFDEPQFNRSVISSNHLKTIVHAGNIFGQRTLYELNQVITLAKKKVANLGDKLHIVFYGAYCLGYDDVVEQHNDDVIRYEGLASKEKVREVMLDADALLLIDPLNRNNCSLPSKLSEYVAYHKPIIAITGEGTPSQLFLHAINQKTFSDRNINELVDFIVSFTLGEINDSDYSLLDKAFYECIPSTIAKSVYMSLEEDV